MKLLTRAKKITASWPKSDDTCHTDPTGLPWPRTWPGVYLFVVVSFIAWMVLLVAVEVIFS